jgi:hypothetical protein
MGSRYDIALGRKMEPDVIAPIVQNKLKKIRGIAACPKCGHTVEIMAVDGHLQVFCKNCDSIETRPCSICNEFFYVSNGYLCRKGNIVSRNTHIIFQTSTGTCFEEKPR